MSSKLLFLAIIARWRLTYYATDQEYHYMLSHIMRISATLRFEELTRNADSFLMILLKREISNVILYFVNNAKIKM